MAKITDIRVRKLMTDGKLKALVSIILDNDIAIHDVKIIQSNDGKVFIAMPSRKDENTGMYRDIVHPLSTETRNEMEEQIIAAYKRYINTVGIDDM